MKIAWEGDTQTHRHTHRHVDSLTNSDQRAELVKIANMAISATFQTYFIKTTCFFGVYLTYMTILDNTTILRLTFDMESPTSLWVY